MSRSDAGRFVGTLFQRDAHAGLTVAVVLLLLFRSARRTGERALDTDTLLVMGAVFCIVAGYFALIPLMEAARSGQGPLSFMTLHLVSVLFFAVKTVCVAWLAWRLHAASGSNP